MSMHEFVHSPTHGQRKVLNVKKTVADNTFLSQLYYKMPAYKGLTYTL